MNARIGLIFLILLMTGCTDENELSQKAGTDATVVADIAFTVSKESRPTTRMSAAVVQEEGQAYRGIEMRNIVPFAIASGQKVTASDMPKAFQIFGNGEKLVASMTVTAKEAGVIIVAGDTKVVEGNGGVYINTAGIGVRPAACRISAANLKAGDTVILTGTLGDHHATILTQRLQMETSLQSDCAPLSHMVQAVLDAGVDVHTIRDITRGGLATVATELAEASGCRINLEEEKLPVSEAVKGISGILGLDPLTMGNEGKMLLAVPCNEAEKALAVLQSTNYGKDAVVAGEVAEGTGVFLLTALDSYRKVLPLRGEGLPSIC